jgi:hypothetical protein
MARTKKVKDIIVEPTIEQSEYISISSMFAGKDLLKDSSNLNTKLNPENHYFQDIHRLDPEGDLPFYYVIHFDNLQYKGGPYKTIYQANKDCAIKLYELYNLEETPIIECEKKIIKKDENNTEMDI